MSSTQTPPRVAVVTGGSRGIGREAVQRQAADGYSLAIAYGSNEAEADAAVAEALAAGVEAFAVRVDVAGEGAMTALFDEVESRFGGLDVVVHSAGLLILSTIADFDLAELDRLHRTNTAARSSSTSRRPVACVPAGASSTSRARSSSSASRPTPATAPARARSRRSP